MNVLVIFHNSYEFFLITFFTFMKKPFLKRKTLSYNRATVISIIRKILASHMESCDKNISKMRNVRGGEIDAPIRKSEFKQKII